MGSPPHEDFKFITDALNDEAEMFRRVREVGRRNHSYGETLAVFVETLISVPKLVRAERAIRLEQMMRKEPQDKWGKVIPFPDRFSERR